MEPENGVGQHPLGPVEQAETFLRTEPQRFQALGVQHLGSLPDLAVALQPTLTYQWQGEVSERRQVTGSTHRALSRDDREQIASQQLDQSLHHDRPDSGMALCQRPCPEQQHGPHQLVGEPLAHARRMATQQAHLEGLRLGGVDPGVGQGTEPGSHPVDHSAVSHRPVHDLQGGAHPLLQVSPDDDLVRPFGHRHHLVEGQGGAVEHHRHW